MAGSPVAPLMTASIRRAMQLARQALLQGKATVGTEWVNHSACMGMDTTRVFYAPDQGKICGNHYRRAYRTCARCPVLIECLAEALLEERTLSQHHIFGVRAGLTPRERLAVGIEAGVRVRSSRLKAG